MKLILVRHGHDMPGQNGGGALSWQGQKQARDTAETILQLGVDHVDVACSSPAQRCVETLDQIERSIGATTRQTASELAPGAEPQDLQQLLWHLWKDQQSTLLFVGHEPQLSNSVLSWCGLPQNGSADSSAPPWILSRGEALLLRPEYDAKSNLVLSSALVTFLGRNRPLPSAKPATRAGVF